MSRPVYGRSLSDSQEHFTTNGPGPPAFVEVHFFSGFFRETEVRSAPCSGLYRVSRVRFPDAPVQSSQMKRPAEGAAKASTRCTAPRLTPLATPETFLYRSSGAAARCVARPCRLQ